MYRRYSRVNKTERDLKPGFHRRMLKPCSFQTVSLSCFASFVWNKIVCVYVWFRCKWWTPVSRCGWRMQRCASHCCWLLVWFLLGERQADLTLCVHVSDELRIYKISRQSVNPFYREVNITETTIYKKYIEVAEIRRLSRLTAQTASLCSNIAEWSDVRSELVWLSYAGAALSHLVWCAAAAGKVLTVLALPDDSEYICMFETPQGGSLYFTVTYLLAMWCRYSLCHCSELCSERLWLCLTSSCPLLSDKAFQYHTILIYLLRRG